MNKFFLIASVMLSAATSPVVARDTRMPATSPSPVADGGVSGVAIARPAVSPTQRYCIVEIPTGSNIPVKTCKTRTDWMQDNDFDPLAKK